MLVKDIELREARLKTLLTQDESLRQVAEQLAPGGEQLLAEMTDLRQVALGRRQQLAAAVQEEEAHGEQVQQVSDVIATTQASLQGEPPAAAGSQEQLKQQIDDHNVGVSWDGSGDWLRMPPRAPCPRTAHAPVNGWRRWGVARVVIYRSVVAASFWIMFTFLVYALLSPLLLDKPSPRCKDHCHAESTALR